MRLDLNRRVHAVVHEILRADVLHAHVLGLDVVGLLRQAAAAEREQRQAEEVVVVHEEHDHHAALRVRVPLARARQALVVGLDVRVGVGDVEGRGDDVAQLEVAAGVV